MDDNVIAAMARWPDVPDVFGWLSLSESGHWRLHPLGDACPDSQDIEDRAGNDAAHKPPHEPSSGESITSPQILRFIDNNYAHDPQKRWFFQNGPQKVYVRLDAAPFILRTQTGSPANPCGLITHNGLAVNAVHEWCLDETGKLYAQTEHGPGLIAGRDLPSILDRLHTIDGDAVLDVLERDPERKTPLQTAPLQATHNEATMPSMQANPSIKKTPFRFATAAEIPRVLGFVRCPVASK